MNELLGQMGGIVDAAKLKSVLLYDSSNPLLFNTGLFLLLFLGFLVIYHLLSRFRWVKMIFVILFSLYFYYKSSAECCFILLGVCVSDYLLGLWLGSARSKAVRVGIVAANVIINVGMLVYFKYLNLIFKTIADLSLIHI